MSLLKLLIIGHGSQAKVWSDNLRCSGHSITIGLRDNSKSFNKAEKAGYRALGLNQIRYAEEKFDAVILLTPDHTHGQILETISSHTDYALRIFYAHGFSIEKEKLHTKHPSFSHLLLAPKAIASEMAVLYNQNQPIPAAFSLEHSNNFAEDTKIIQAMANGIGMTGKLIQTTFKEETICDLFSEQSLLCSSIPFLIKKSYDALTKAGVSPDIAFLECCLESKYILNTLMQVGFSKFFEIISPNALIGANKATELLYSEEFLNNFESLLKDISNGQFYNEIDHADVDTLREKMVSLYAEGDMEKTRKSLKDFLAPPSEKGKKHEVDNQETKIT